MESVLGIWENILFYLYYTYEYFEIIFLVMYSPLKWTQVQLSLTVVTESNIDLTRTDLDMDQKQKQKLTNNRLQS